MRNAERWGSAEIVSYLVKVHEVHGYLYHTPLVHHINRPTAKSMQTACSQAHTHCTHTNMHTHTNTHMRLYMQPHTCQQIHACSQMHMRIHTHLNTFTQNLQHFIFKDSGTQLTNSIRV